MRTVVLDSSALLAHFLGQPGGRAVKAVLADARRRKCVVYMGAVNLAEAVYIVARGRGQVGVEAFVKWLSQLRVTVLPAQKDDAIAAGLLKSRVGVPYGDCFAVALAHRLKAEVLTSDRDFEKVQEMVGVVWIR